MKLSQTLSLIASGIILASTPLFASPYAPLCNGKVYKKGRPACSATPTATSNSDAADVNHPVSTGTAPTPKSVTPVPAPNYYGQSFQSWLNQMTPQQINALMSHTSQSQGGLNQLSPQQINALISHIQQSQGGFDQLTPQQFNTLMSHSSQPQTWLDQLTPQQFNTFISQAQQTPGWLSNLSPQEFGDLMAHASKPQQAQIVVYPQTPTPTSIPATITTQSPVPKPPQSQDGIGQMTAQQLNDLMAQNGAHPQTQIPSTTPATITTQSPVPKPPQSQDGIGQLTAQQLNDLMAQNGAHPQTSTPSTTPASITTQLPVPKPPLSQDGIGQLTAQQLNDLMAQNGAHPQTQIPSTTQLPHPITTNVIPSTINRPQALTIPLKPSAETFSVTQPSAIVILPPLHTTQFIPISPKPHQKPQSVSSTVVITAVPQVPVSTSTPAVPLAIQPSVPTTVAGNHVIPNTPPMTQTFSDPAVAIPPAQTAQPIVITAVPQVPASTSNPAIPLATQPSVPTTVAGNHVIPSTPPIAQTFTSKPTVAVPQAQPAKPVVVMATPQVPVSTSTPAIPLATQSNIPTAVAGNHVIPNTPPITQSFTSKPTVAVPQAQPAKPVVVMAVPQIPVSTVTQATPLATTPNTPTTVAGNHIIPNTPPITQTFSDPAVAIPPAQTAQPIVITATPQVQVATSNVAIPLATQPSVPTIIASNPVIPNTPPIAQTFTSKPTVAIPQAQPAKPVVMTAVPQVPVSTITTPQYPVIQNPTITSTLIPIASSQQTTIQNPHHDLSPHHISHNLDTSNISHKNTTKWVVPSLGKQQAHNIPKKASENNRSLECVASGFGWRKIKHEDGKIEYVGVHPDLRTTDMIVQDIPANHHIQVDCLIVVERNQKAL